MKDIFRRLQEKEILVSDGAMGTLLMEGGLKLGDCPESINLKDTSILTSISELYVNAGADIIQTNTFGGSSLKLSTYSLSDKTEEINKRAVLAIRNTIKGRAYISGSVGPSGKLLKPFGDIEEDQMYNSFKRQIGTLIDEGVDLLCIETMSDLNEARIAIKAARDISKTIPIIATMTFDSTLRGFYTIMGVNIPNASKELESAGANIIGSNCGNGIENMIKIAREFREKSTLPVIIQSNAGLPVIKDNKTFYPESPEFMADRCKELISLGVNIIGGCCGTTPEHIRAFREVVDRVS